MSASKGGPHWQVLQRFPKAHALKQQKTGYWKVFTGDRETGNQYIGEGPHAATAWADAARKLR